MTSDKPPPLVIAIGDPAGIGPDRLRRGAPERGTGEPLFRSPPDLLRSLSKRLASTRRSSKQSLVASQTILTGACRSFRSKIGSPANRVDLTAAPPLRRLSRLPAPSNGCATAWRGRSLQIRSPRPCFTRQDSVFPGHTEFLGELAKGWGAMAFPVMMIWSETLAVVPVTIHIPLSEAPKALSKDLVVKTARVVDRDLRAHFGIARPRLAVAGLNPHAGEGGAMGHEETTIIAPAIEILRAEGIDVIGPLPADMMFHASARARYDVALTMYRATRASLRSRRSHRRTRQLTLGRRLCAPRPIMAPRSISPARESPIPPASLQR